MRIVGTALGLLAGVTLGPLLSSCDCFAPPPVPLSFASGTFVPSTDYNVKNQLGEDLDYTLTIDREQMRAVETFTRDGKRHRTEYALDKETETEELSGAVPAK
jgi:hypothetical protein